MNVVSSERVARPQDLIFFPWHLGSEQSGHWVAFWFNFRMEPTEAFFSESMSAHHSHLPAAINYFQKLTGVRRIREVQGTKMKMSGYSSMCGYCVACDCFALIAGLMPDSTKAPLVTTKQFINKPSLKFPNGPLSYAAGILAVFPFHKDHVEGTTYDGTPQHTDDRKSTKKPAPRKASLEAEEALYEQFRRNGNEKFHKNPDGSIGACLCGCGRLGGKQGRSRLSCLFTEDFFTRMANRYKFNAEDRHPKTPRFSDDDPLFGDPYSRKRPRRDDKSPSNEPDRTRSRREPRRAPNATPHQDTSTR